MKKIKRKAINKAIKKKRKEYIKEVKHQRRYVRTITLKCKKCKRVYKINTTKSEIYTVEVKKKWLCYFCKKEEK